MSKVIIVGGGISGLALAYRLEQADPTVEVTVLEQQDRIGGTIWTERRDGFQVEIGPNGFLDNKPSTIELCRELGLGDQLLPASAAAGKNRYLFLDGKLHLLPNSIRSFLQSELLSWHGKLALMAERWRGRRRAGADESIEAFARRRAGPEAARIFADAMVTGIYAGDPRLLSVRACFPRLVMLEEQHGGILRGMNRVARQRRAELKAQGKPPPTPPRMWSFRAGLRLLVETLRGKLRREPVTGVAVCRVERNENEQLWNVHAEGQDRWSADAVVLACPAYRQAAILSSVDAELAEQISGIAYNRIAVVALGYRREDVAFNLDGFGYIAPQRLRRDVLGVQWCSSIFAERAPAGMVLLRAMSGGWHRAEAAGWDDARLLDAVRAELRIVMGIDRPPVFHHIARWDRAIPQYHVGHLDRVASIEARSAQHPGLFLAGNAYRGVALNDCSEQAGILALRIKNFLASTHRC